MNFKATASVLLVALGAAGLAQAQAVAEPVVIDGAMSRPISKEAIRQDAQGLTGATVTSNVPTRAGEASTMTHGAPNLVTSNPTPTERMSAYDQRVARNVYDSAPGTSAPSNSPSVFEGGTPQ
jgi:hypothetical protein